MTTTTTDATTPAPACGPATGLAVAENANPAAAGPHAPSVTHPNPTTKKENPEMTDPRTPDVTDEDRRIARDWAESVHSYPDTWTDRLRAAARVILHGVPAPPLPTLADMTPEERAECRWMQCDVGGEDARAVIFNPHWEDGSARVMWPDGVFTCPNWERVTPRPDLPRFVWPGDKKPAPALPEGWRLADHPRYGRVFVTTPEPDCDGDLWFIDPSADPGNMEDWCDPDVLTFLYEQGADQ